MDLTVRLLRAALDYHSLSGNFLFFKNLTTFGSLVYIHVIFILSISSFLISSCKALCIRLNQKCKMLLNTSQTAELEKPFHPNFFKAIKRGPEYVIQRFKNLRWTLTLRGQCSICQFQGFPYSSLAYPLFYSPTKSSSSRPFLHRTPINHLVGAEYKWTLHLSWSAAWAEGMRVDQVTSGRSVKSVCCETKHGEYPSWWNQSMVRGLMQEQGSRMWLGCDCVWVFVLLSWGSRGHVLVFLV